MRNLMVRQHFLFILIDGMTCMPHLPVSNASCHLCHTVTLCPIRGAKRRVPPRGQRSCVTQLISKLKKFVIKRSKYFFTKRISHGALCASTTSPEEALTVSKSHINKRYLMDPCLLVTPPPPREDLTMSKSHSTKRYLIEPCLLVPPPP